MSKQYKSPFITDKCTAEQADALIKAGVPMMEANAEVPWSEIEKQAGTDVGYSRGWLVVRHAFLHQNSPDLLIDSSKLISEAFAKAEAAGKSGEFKDLNALEPVVIKLREEMHLSWGEIAVRLGIPESRVRRAYRSNGIKKDLGLRIGKGGRFAYGAGELYEDNRKAEGAYIKLDKHGKPSVEELLNYVPKEGTTTKQQQGQVISRIVKLRKLFVEGAGRTSEERVSAQERVREMMAQYGITERMIADWVAHRATKGKGKAA